MTLPVKVAGAAVVVGGGSLAGCYFGGVFDDTPWVSLKTETSSGSGTTNPYQGKVGEKYSIYLLAVHGTEGENQNFNESKWKDLHKRYLADLNSTDANIKNGISTDFGDGKVHKENAYLKQESGASASDPKPLNEVCKGVYGKSVGESGDIDFGSNATDDSKRKLARDILRYCSPLGQKPISIGEEEYSGDVIGTGSEKANLASTKKSENYYFWQAQNRWFIDEAKNKTSTDNAFFFQDAFFDGSGTNKTLNISIRDICRKAYGVTKNTGSSSTKDNPIESDVKKYCSFKEITS